MAADPDAVDPFDDIDELDDPLDLAGMPEPPAAVKRLLIAAAVADMDRVLAELSGRPDR